jgi:hypothetical protein
MSNQDLLLKGYRDIKQKAEIAFQEANFFEALILWGEAVEVNPFDFEVYSKRCQTNLKLKYLKDALVDARRCFELEPKSIEAILLCANVHFQLGNKEAEWQRYKSKMENFNQDHLHHFQEVEKRKG